MSSDCDLSIVAPIFNEKGNILPLVEDILREVTSLGLEFEIVLVNDGSTDGSEKELDAVAGNHKQVKVIHFAHNCGQTLALAAGMQESTGRSIVMIDGDRQNDPADIGMLVKKLDEGYDCVSGWRKNRHDAGLRRLLSRIANRIIQRLFHVPVHDLGCTLKAYRADALNPRELFGEMHRFLPLYVMARGGKVTEMVVRHHPRAAGVSKYGSGRICRVISDICLLRILQKYRTRPSHLFAKAAQNVFLLAIGIVVLSIVIQLFAGWVLWPIGVLSAVIIAVGAVLLLAAGLICELVIRNRYLIGSDLPFSIARKVNFGDG